MGFSASLAGVVRAGWLVAIVMFCAVNAAAETIPGPPIGASAGDSAGAFCALRGGTSGNAVAFAAGVAIVAIAARRRGEGTHA